jgi:hypothetical protein
MRFPIKKPRKAGLLNVSAFVLISELWIYSGLCSLRAACCYFGLEYQAICGPIKRNYCPARSNPAPAPLIARWPFLLPIILPIPFDHSGRFTSAVCNAFCPVLVDIAARTPRMPVVVGLSLKVSTPAAEPPNAVGKINGMMPARRSVHFQPHI